jgi:hypothetical protein
MCDEAIAETSSKRLEATALIVRGAAKAGEGRLQEGREGVAEGRGLLRDLGDRMTWAGICIIEAEMELASGDAVRAEAALAEGHEVLLPAPRPAISRQSAPDALRRRSPSAAKTTLCATLTRSSRSLRLTTSSRGPPWPWSGGKFWLGAAISQVRTSELPRPRP